MLKSTPGPWAFCNDTLCQATGDYLHLGKFIESPGLGSQAEPNKRLIEAAPKLLVALEKLISITAPICEGAYGPEVDAAYEAARAATQSATGDQK